MFGVGFDPRSLELLGPPVPLLSDVAASNDVISGGGQFAGSRTGTLVYLSGHAEGGSYPVLWMDAQGNTTPLVAQPGVYGAPRLSPDGRQLAYIASGNDGFDVWVDDLAGGTPTQLTFLGKVNNELAWAPDSKHLVYSDGSALWWIRSDGAGQAQLLKDNLDNPRPTSFAPSGGKEGRLLFVKATSGLPDLMTLPIDMSDPEHPRAGKVEPFLARPEIVEVDGAFSPDGKFIAYASNESGSEQIYVRPFPGPGGRWKVSADGGKFPAWSAATHELLFLGADDHIMAARYAIEGSGGDSFRVEAPHVWSPRPVLRISVQQNFDVSRDGKRVVMFPKQAVQEAGGDLHATFLINFFDELRQRVPLGK
jgi:eukaryotic-like serine/threonine-protein kinase